RSRRRSSSHRRRCDCLRPVPCRRLQSTRATPYEAPCPEHQHMRRGYSWRLSFARGTRRGPCSPTRARQKAGQRDRGAPSCAGAWRPAASGGRAEAAPAAAPAALRPGPCAAPSALRRSPAGPRQELACAVPHLPATARAAVPRSWLPAQAAPLVELSAGVARAVARAGRGLRAAPHAARFFRSALAGEAGWRSLPWTDLLMYCVPEAVSVIQHYLTFG